MRKCPHCGGELPQIGRPPKASPEKIQALLAKGLTVEQIAKKLRCGRSTVYANMPR